MLRIPRFIGTMLSAMWLGLTLPVAVPHCDVVAQGLHDLIAHSHGAHPHADRDHSVAGHHEGDDRESDTVPPLDPQCEMADDTALADATAAAKLVVKAPVGKNGAGFDLAAFVAPHGMAVSGPPAPPRWRHGAVAITDHFQRNHRLLI